MPAPRSPRGPLSNDGALSRRRLLQFGATGVGVLTLAACSSTSTSGGSSATKLSGQIVWAGYGGSTETALKEVFFTDFTEKTSVKVVTTTIEASVMYGMLGGDSGEYDAIFMAPSDIVNYKEHIRKLPASVPRDDTLPESLQPYSFGTLWVGYAQGYLPATFPSGGPTSWADFWDVEKFPGKRAVPGVYADYMYEAALLADGVAAEDLYPMDFTRATAKLDALRSHFVFYTDYPQIQTLLTSGSAAIAFGPNGQYASLTNAGTKVTTVWTQAFVEPNPWVVPAKAPDSANTFALAEYLSNPKKQAQLAKRTNYGPANKAAFDHLDAATIANLPNAPQHTTTISVDAKGRAADFDAESKKYTAWLSA